MKTQLFIAFQHLVPQHLLSGITGKLASSQITPLKNILIKLFVKHYQVNLAEAQFKRTEDYKNFNDFFTRALEDGARNIDTAPSSIVSPSDGVISEMGAIQDNQLLAAKGQQYSLQKLLANDDALIQRFISGDFLTCYLSPKDYHRVHMPISGTLVKSTYVPGDLFSVNNTTAQHVPNLFARNERLICEFETAIGSVAVILVGALIVAGIETVWSGHVAPSNGGITVTDHRQQNIVLNKGDELGRFKLGSTVILLFQNGSTTMDNDLSAGSALRMGQLIAKQNAQT